MIDRKNLITRHNPRLTTVDRCSPLTVGNGGFAFTADITGLQTLYAHYESEFPLCTMAEWAWHTTPRTADEQGELLLTEYAHAGRTVFYPVEKKAGNEGVYNWLRHNPHKFNLARVFLTADGEEISAADIGDVSQTLHIYEGRLESHFTVKGQPVRVETICDFATDTLGFSVQAADNITVNVAFPYGHHEISASDWSAENYDRHSSSLQLDLENPQNSQISIVRRMDNISYFANFCEVDKFLSDSKHVFNVPCKEFTLNFSETETKNVLSFAALKQRTAAAWQDFWQNCGVMDFSKSSDVRANELERRIILSLYLCRVQSCGTLPPAETGLTLNSWYGRFHLEMHAWHSAFWVLYGNSALLEKSLAWYKKILPKAKENAKINGYKGARWPKQVCPDGTDSPSPIAPLLVWQQPHILYMLDMIYKVGKNGKNEAEKRDFLAEYWEIARETADFICDFLQVDENGKYNLVAPLIPAQEEHEPTEVKNPTLELEYFRYGLKIAIDWAKLLEIGNSEIFSQDLEDSQDSQDLLEKQDWQKWRQWQKIYANIAEPPHKNGVYLAHENCPATFEQFNRDHPSMVGALGLLPQDRTDRKIMQATLEKVLDCWQMQTMWGWDFAMMSMTAVRLGLPKLAVDLLLMDTPKNAYVASGNNFQQTRKDLPLYLPGNGSLLLAAAMLVGRLPDGWVVEVEGVSSKFS
ncbi:MAG: glycoside hydrolase family 65 [Defluviitaleaceae bacterium]|nr:glycoside hydrolase family 65 [Defluviitaleaceae bacterium]